MQKVLRSEEEIREEQEYARIKERRKRELRAAIEEARIRRQHAPFYNQNDEDKQLDEQYIFEYQGFYCRALKPENTLWLIESVDGSDVPETLRGCWTGRVKCREAIDGYIKEQKPQSKVQ